MDAWILPAIYTAGGLIVVPIVLGVISNAIWEWVRDTISYRSSNYIPVKGNWLVETAYQHTDGTVEKLTETLEILQQFGSRFRGQLRSPHPNKQGKHIELEVRGEFKDKFHAIFWYQHRSNALTDMGAGVLQFSTNHDVADGGSTNFGVTSEWKTANTTFVMRRS